MTTLFDRLCRRFNPRGWKTREMVNNAIELAYKAEKPHSERPNLRLSCICGGAHVGAFRKHGIASEIDIRLDAEGFRIARRDWVPVTTDPGDLVDEGIVCTHTAATPAALAQALGDIFKDFLRKAHTLHLTHGLYAG